MNIVKHEKEGRRAYRNIYRASYERGPPFLEFLIYQSSSSSPFSLVESSVLNMAISGESPLLEVSIMMSGGNSGHTSLCCVSPCRSPGAQHPSSSRVGRLLSTPTSAGGWRQSQPWLRWWWLRASTSRPKSRPDDLAWARPPTVYGVMRCCGRTGQTWETYR